MGRKNRDSSTGERPLIRETIYVITLLAALLPLAVSTLQPASEIPISLTCSGSLIEPQGLDPTPMTILLTLGSKITIETKGTHSNARLLSSNAVQTQFVTKTFTGEYFHYSGDLFLIFRTGHLARLLCAPSSTSSPIAQSIASTTPSDEERLPRYPEAAAAPQ